MRNVPDTRKAAQQHVVGRLHYGDIHVADVGRENGNLRHGRKHHVDVGIDEPRDQRTAVARDSSDGHARRRGDGLPGNRSYRPADSKDVRRFAKLVRSVEDPDILEENALDCGGLRPELGRRGR